MQPYVFKEKLSDHNVGMIMNAFWSNVRFCLLVDVHGVAPLSELAVFCQ